MVHEHFSGFAERRHSQSRHIHSRVDDKSVEVVPCRGRRAWTRRNELPALGPEMSSVNSILIVDHDVANHLRDMGGSRVLGLLLVYLDLDSE